MTHGPAPTALLCPLCGRVWAGLSTQYPGHQRHHGPCPAPPHPQPCLCPLSGLLRPPAGGLPSPEGGGGPGHRSLDSASPALSSFCPGSLHSTLCRWWLPGCPECWPLPRSCLPFGLPSHPEALLFLGCVCVAIWALVLCHLGLVFGLEAPGGWMDNTTSSLGINTPINGSPVCLEAWDPASVGPAHLSLSLLLFFLPLTITAFCYVGCLRALAGSGLSHRRKLRAVWVAGGALLTLLLCLGPYNDFNVAGFLYPNMGGHWQKLGLLTGAWSVVLNPLVTVYLGGGFGHRTSCVARMKGSTAQK